MDKRVSPGYGWVKTRFWLTICLACLALTGCIDVTEDIWLDESGRCRLEITTAIREDWLRADPQGKLDGEVRTAMERLRDQAVNEFGARVSLRDTTQDGKRFYTFIANLDSPEATAALLNHFHQPPADHEAGQASRPARHVTRFTQPYRGTLHFEKHLSGATPGAQDTPQMRALLASLFRDNQLTVTLHAPGISRANGEISADGTRVTWSIPLSRFIEEPGFEMKLSADVPFRPIRWLWWLGGALGVACLIVIIRLKRKPRDNAIYWPY